MFYKIKIKSYLLLKLILLISFFPAFAWENNFPYQFAPESLNVSSFMQLKSLSSIGIRNHAIDDIDVEELSGLAWDNKRNTLYAVSDTGTLFHIKLIIKGDQILKTQTIKAYPLLDKKGKALKKKFRDSEGLSAKRDKQGNITELIVSFERKFRIVRYSTKGKYLGKIKLPKPLKKKEQYQDANKGLEAVTVHPRYGVLTAAEQALKSSPAGYQTIYSTSGKQWHFKRTKRSSSSVTGLETLPNGDVLILERSYSGLFSPMLITLRQLKLSSCAAKNYCEIEDIAIFNSIDGWRIDNFEGLTRYKGNQFIMSSDNNENPLQNTVLVLFELK